MDAITLRLCDRNTKADAYAVLGVKELWLIDESTETVEVRVLVGGKFQRGELLRTMMP